MVAEGCTKLPDRSQPPVGQGSPYYEDMWRTYCCLTSFFSIVDVCLSCEDIARQVVRWCPDGDFGDFLRPVFSASRAQRVSDLHLKFALRPTLCEQVWQTSTLRRLRLGEEKKKQEDEEQTTG